jgi:DNA invertase Pin-like site-specific DNA recombinase
MSARRKHGLVPLEEDGLVYALRYLRVSGKEQKDKGISIPAQDAETTRYVLRMGERGWIEDGRYEDVLSGKRDERRDYQRLLERLRELRAQGKRVVVVVFKTDRFGRRLAERLRAWEELLEAGAELHSVIEGGRQDRLNHNIRALLSEEEVAALSERVRSTRKYVVERGWRPIGRPPWGYRWRVATDDERLRGAPRQVLEEEPAEAPAAREAWRLRAEDARSLHDVAAWAARLPEGERGGRNLNYAAIRQMFKAPVYVGRPETLYVDGEPRRSDVLDRPRGNWPALVDDETWRRVQEVGIRQRKMPPQASARYLLTGLLRCWRCTCRMDGRAYSDKRGLARGKTWRSRRYRCISRHLGAAAAGVRCAVEAPADVVEGLVVALLGAALSALDQPETAAELAALEADWLAEQAERGDGLRGQVAAQTARLNRARELLAKAAEEKLSGELDPEGYAAVREKLVRDIEAAQASLAELRARRGATVTPMPIATVLASVPDWRGALERTEDVAGARLALGELIEQVVPLPSGERWRRTWRVHIEWTGRGRAVAELAARCGEPGVVGYFEQPNYPTASGSEAAG